MKMAKDPICGMEVDEKKTKFNTLKNGKKYYFCSKNCHDKFTGIKMKNTITDKNTAKTTISISGMHCASCASVIERSLKKTRGVVNASVNYATEKASVEFDENENNIGEARLKVIGMDNPHCVGTVGDALNLVKGIISKELSVNENAIIKFDPKLTNLEKIKKAIRQSGYEPVEQTASSVDREKEARQKEIKRLKQEVIIGFIITVPIF